jgi:hypothetical protein
MRNVNERKWVGSPKGVIHLLAFTQASLYGTLLRHEHDIAKAGSLGASCG